MTKTPVHGLVMAGGQSRRMGRDKALIEYHGTPQVLWLARLLREVCDQVFVSCRADQSLGLPEEAQFLVIHDLEPGMGPLGGLVSGFHADPEVAWFAVGCDLPRLTADTARFLLAERDPAKLCTAFRSSQERLPEPLCAIYEPSIEPVLRTSMESGRRCPRRILLDEEHRVKLVDLPFPDALENVNTPEEEDLFRQRKCQPKP